MKPELIKKMCPSVTENPRKRPSARTMRAQRRASLRGEKPTTKEHQSPLIQPNSKRSERKTTSPFSASSPPGKKPRTQSPQEQGSDQNVVTQYKLRTKGSRAPRSAADASVSSADSSVLHVSRAPPLALASAKVNSVTPAAPRRQINFSNDDHRDESSPVPVLPYVVDIYPGLDDKSRCRCPTEPQRNGLGSCDAAQVFLIEYGQEHLDYLHERELLEFPHPARTATGSPIASPTSSAASSVQSSGEDDDLLTSILAHSSGTSTDTKFLEDNRRSFKTQPLLTPQMRAVLISWLVEVGIEFKFSEESFHLSVSLMDALFNCGPTLAEYQHFKRIRASLEVESDDDEESSQAARMDSDKFFCIKKSELQALGCTCAWMACKLEEKTPPSQDDFAFISDHSVSTTCLRTLEFRVCQQLDFNLHRLTPLHFVNAYLRASNACPCRTCQYENPGLRDMVMYLLNLSRLSSELLYKPPSLVAAAALYLARATLGIETSPHKQFSYSHKFWSPTLEHYTNYTPKDLRRPVLLIYRYHLQAEQLGLAAFEKFSKDRHYKVALKTARRLEDLDLPGVKQTHEDLLVAENTED